MRAHLSDVPMKAFNKIFGQRRQPPLDPDGIAVYQANGTAAGQTVFHYHVHLIPREAGEGFDFANRKTADRGELSRLAARLMESLQRDPQK